MTRLKLVILPCLLVLAWACGGGGGGGDAPPPGSPSPSPSPPSSTLFRDITASTNINYRLAFDAELEASVSSMALITYGGAAIGDITGNGYLDIFVTRGGGAPNLFYRNLGNFVFQEAAHEVGLAYTRSAGEELNYRHSGPVFADMNGNGHLDLFLGGIFGDPSMIFRNNGNGTFTDVTAGSGIDTIEAEQTISASFGDYDLDGRLDLFLTHWNTPRNLSNPGDTEHLWRNVSEGEEIRFESVSVEAGISPSILNLPNHMQSRPQNADYTFTATFARMTDSLYPDLLIAADYNTSQVFRNNGDGTFTNVTNVHVITDDYGMGTAVADFRNIGRLDWFVSSIFNPFAAEVLEGAQRPPRGNMMYINNGGVDTLTEETPNSIRHGGWGWGACAADFENNARLDIFHVSGWPLSNPYGDFRADRSRLFIAHPAGGFNERSTAYGIVDTTDARGVVCADFNNNGFIDILVLHNGRPRSATLWENTATNNNWLRVELEGLPPNTQAAGARIRARIGEVEQMREIMIGANYISQVPTIQVIGLGAAASADELTVEWPDEGTERTILTNVHANQTLVISHPGLANGAD